MTSFTSRIIRQVYGFAEDSYKFQLMYMPMDTEVFHNDNFSEVVGSLLPIIFLTLAKLANQTISATNDLESESYIKNAM